MIESLLADILPIRWDARAAVDELRTLWASSGDVVLVVVACLAAALVVGRLARWLLRRGADSLEKRARLLPAVTLRALRRPATPLAVAIALRVVVGYYLYEGRLAESGYPNLASKVLLLLATGYVAYALVDAVDAWLKLLALRTASKLDDMLVPLVRTSLRAIVIIFVLLYLAELLAGGPVGTVLAGLGIGGVAIGLAAQDTVKNLFGSLMLFSDRPFEMGDRIVFEGHDGTVEGVGFRSTRLRTQDGNLVTIPNADLASKPILNVGKRPNIRRSINLGLTYDTPPDKIERAIAILKQILDSHEGMRVELPPRVVFNEFQESSLNLSVTYWYHPPDYWAFAAFSEQVNLEILRRFDTEGIDLAFATRSVVLSGDADRPLRVEQSGPAAKR
ncbi:MAG: mechanosensitive ion channel family protein [Planctomycetia bacterium]|nr:mechanosensitive ion channel family protein [Planctomycetia bacterium]